MGYSKIYLFWAAPVGPSKVIHAAIFIFGGGPSRSSGLEVLVKIPWPYLHNQHLDGTLFCSYKCHDCKQIVKNELDLAKEEIHFTVCPNILTPVITV